MQDSTALLPNSALEPPKATAKGMQFNITLTEPVVFLEEYNKDDPSTKKCNIIRGQLHLKVTEATEIKKIWIRFRGQIEIQWPRADRMVKRTLLTQGVTFFDHGDTALQRNEFGADFFQLSDVTSAATGKAKVMATADTPFQQSQSFASKDADGCLFAPEHSSAILTKCLRRPDAAKSRHYYKSFPVGDYLYNFEFVVDGSLPETIKTDQASVKYSLQASIEPSGRFCSPLNGGLDIPIVRLPAENSLELIEPIAASRNWCDKLQVKVLILGKSLSLGSRIPINLKLMPTANLVCHWIKVYVTEYVQHCTRGKGARRLQLPAKRVLLFEKQGGLESRSTYPGSEIHIISGGGMEPVGNTPNGDSTNKNTNLLGAIPSDTEIDLKVQLPSCHEMKRRGTWQRLHFDTDVEMLQVNHWIQVVLRFSDLENGDLRVNKPIEMTVESPFHILSCKATPANIFVPAYEMNRKDPIRRAQTCECACPGSDPSGSKSSEQDFNTHQPINSHHVNLLPPNGSTPPFESSTNGSGTKSSDIRRPPRAYLGETRRDDSRSLPIFCPISSAQSNLKILSCRPVNEFPTIM